MQVNWQWCWANVLTCSIALDFIAFDSDGMTIVE